LTTVRRGCCGCSLHSHLGSVVSHAGKSLHRNLQGGLSDFQTPETRLSLSSYSPFAPTHGLRWRALGSDIAGFSSLDFRLRFLGRPAAVGVDVGSFADKGPGFVCVSYQLDWSECACRARPVAVSHRSIRPNRLLRLASQGQHPLRGLRHPAPAPQHASPFARTRLGWLDCRSRDGRAVRENAKPALFQDGCVCCRVRVIGAADSPDIASFPLQEMAEMKQLTQGSQPPSPTSSLLLHLFFFLFFLLVCPSCSFVSSVPAALSLLLREVSCSVFLLIVVPRLSRPDTRSNAACFRDAVSLSHTRSPHEQRRRASSGSSSRRSSRRATPKPFCTSFTGCAQRVRERERERERETEREREGERGRERKREGEKEGEKEGERE
jgi:hypothetical protein